MKQCLACWEDIENDELICLQCGSNQEEVKDYLALVVLKQRKKKIDVPKETPVLDYIFEVDPQAQKDITVKGEPPKREQPFVPVAQSQEHPSQSGHYQPDRPSWLGTPDATSESSTKTTPEKKAPISSKTKPGTTSKAKTIVCPKCSEESPFLKYCKFCGQKLQRECPHCRKILSVKAKFCTGCGESV